MIENQIRNHATTLNPAQFAGTSGKSGNTTAFESLLSSLASAARNDPQPAKYSVPERSHSDIAAASVRVKDTAAERRSEISALRRDDTRKIDRAERPERPGRPEKLERRDDVETRFEKSKRVDDTKDTKTEKSAEGDNVDSTSKSESASEASKNETSATEAAPEENATKVDANAVAAAPAPAEVEATSEAAVEEGAPTLELTAETAVKGAQEETNPEVKTADVPVDTETQEALSGETPAREKGPALDGKALMQDMKNPLAATSKTAELPGAPAARVAVQASSAEDNAVAQAVAMAASQAGQAAANTSRVNSANTNAAGGVQSVSSVSGTSNATPLATAAPAQAPAVQTSAPVSQAAPTYAPNLSQQVFDQLQNHLTRLRPLGEGMHQLKLAINPETFGPVRVAVNFQADGTVQLQLLGANDAARDQLRQVMADLRRDLASTGLTAQLDLAESDQEFAQFTGAGQETEQGDTPEMGPRGQEVGRSNTTQDEREEASSPRVGDVLKDGTDGSVDMFA